MFGLAIAAMVASVAMIACSKEDAPAPQEEPEFYTVQLGWGGEIVDIAYEPLGTRAATDDLYGIQVYSRPNNNSTATSWEPYGVFDDPTDISIDLASGNKYKFLATMVVDGKERILKEWVMGYEEEYIYSFPFCIQVETLGSFIYQTGSLGSSSFRHRFQEGETALNDAGGCYNRPNVERFYGELEDFVPSSTNADATISMKRANFGAKFIAEGALAKSGTLDIQISDAPKMSLTLTEGEDSISDIFTFWNVQEAWSESAAEDYVLNGYYEIIDVSFKWIRPDETGLQIGTFPITFKRNTTTVVTIKMENDVVEGDQTGGVGFSIASSEKGEMPVDPNNSVTIVDGEVETGE